MTIKGLIFDFDGLILDTETPDFTTWQKIFLSYNINLPFEKWAQCIGTSNDAFDVVSYLEEQIDEKIDHAQIRDFHKKLLLDDLLTQSTLPGVEEYIKRAKDLRFKLAVASSSSFQWLESHLTRLNLINEFDAIVSSNDVKEVKPHPALYLEALNKLNLNANEVIAFEDSINGMNAAQAANIFCVVVPNSVTRQLNWDKADLIINSMAAVKLEKIISVANEQTIYSE
jgi:HAD superfamily hydrolase (TIGR01509 family)